MKTIKFTCHGASSPAYNCNHPGDQSGEYTRVESTKEALETLRVVENSISTTGHFKDSLLHEMVNRAIEFLENGE